MSNLVARVAVRRSRALDLSLQAALVIGGSLFVAFCARLSIPLPWTPVPLTVQDLGVLLVGLSLGSRRGFLALVLYLVEGASGMPVFSSALPGQFAQLLGPSGGYLIAYPFVAGLTGYIFERGKPTFARAVCACVAGDIVLFTGGVAQIWLLIHSLSHALRAGLYPFVLPAVTKVMLAAGAARSWQGIFGRNNSAVL